MAQEKFAVQLTVDDRSELERLTHSGQHSARVINRVRILLKTDEGWSASQMAAALDTSPRTVFRTKRRYVEEGLAGVLHDRPQASRYRKLDDRGEAHLIALACSDATTGRCPPEADWPTRWWGWDGGSLSYETVRHRLKKTSSSPGKSGPPEADASPR